MPLFVPILRLLMLFLNVYDSYKTLKEPPPSSRNAGRPSVRAISQRKRDMKGCLAVWVVWASFSVYERTMEAIVCLFIPFYDEFKSLTLLFLILTRARGAEPIYLHVIRPLVKPYTRTLDATLEMMHYIGDFIFALSTYPVRLGLDWYERRFGSSEAFDSESDTQSSSSNDVNTSELPTSFLASSGVVRAPVVTGNEDNVLTQFPRRASNESPLIRSPNRHPSADNSTSRHVSRKAKQNSSNNPDIEPIFFDDNGRANEPSQRSSSQRAGASNGKEASSDVCDKSHKPATRRQESGSSSRHQIWYPPQSSYINDELDGEPAQTLRLEHANQTVLLALEHQQYEEWRQYPPFPSAYPPTPLVTTTRLATTSTLVSLQPAIEEEKAQEDFHKSLLPPREPLNPSHAGDLSDKYKHLGISSSPDVDDADDSMSADDCDDEDDFDITLRTPLPPRGSLRSQIPSRRFISMASASSAVPSRSSALTTAYNGSAMLIDSSSLSDSSPSFSASKTNIISPVSVIGKKRSYPRSKMTSVRNRVRQIESETSQDISESDHDAQQVEGTSKVEEMGKASSPSNLRQSGNDDAAAAATSSGISSAADDPEEIPPEEKRRKIIRSSQTPKVPRIVNSSRPIRPRVARYASPPSQSQKAKLRNLTGTSNTRNPTRLRPGTSTRKVKENEDQSSLSASSSASQIPLIPLKPGKRDLTRKRT